MTLRSEYLAGESIVVGILKRHSNVRCYGRGSAQSFTAHRSLRPVDWLFHNMIGGWKENSPRIRRTFNHQEILSILIEK